MAEAERERAEAETVRVGRLREQEADHAAKMAQAERERAEAEEELVKQLHQREAEQKARVAMLLVQGLESVAEREHDFETACAEKQEHLQTLAVKEDKIQARVAAISSGHFPPPTAAGVAGVTGELAGCRAT